MVAGGMWSLIDEDRGELMWLYPNTHDSLHSPVYAVCFYLIAVFTCFGEEEVIIGALWI
jgi:hypothetical protein